jgi:glycine/D-amino acid oxidase-like deaminating enzyme
MARAAEVVIVGAGIVGSATAYYLARRGLRPLLLEAGSVPGEQSRKNWGFVRQQGRDPREVPLVAEANRLWRGLERELQVDVAWTQGGNLALAATAERMALLEAWLPVAREHGLDTVLLRGQDVQRVVPGLAGRWAGGLYTPSDGHAEPAKATDALCQAAVARGARLETGVAARGVLVQDGAVRGVVTDRGEVEAAWVVCAAGAWSARLARTAGLSLPQRWVRATVARTTAAPPVTAAGVWGPTLAFRQRRDGSFDIAAGGAADHDVTLDSLRHLRLFWPTYWRNRRLFRFHVGRPLLRDLLRRLPGAPARRRGLAWDRAIEPPPNRAKVRRSLAELQRLLPALPPLRVERAWAGYIDATPDLIPVLGEVARPRGFVFATGFSGHGFALGPVAGRLVAELILDGRASLPIDAFRFSRFAEGALGPARNVL